MNADDVAEAGFVYSDSSSFQTSYKITGTLAFVEEAIHRIEQNYHPLGYGTHFSAPIENEDGTWTAFGSRANSCD